MPNTGLLNPSADAADVGGFTNPTDAYTNNAVYASVSTQNNSHRYYNYNISIPAGSTNFFIELDVLAYAAGTLIVNGDRAELSIEISVNGGTSWSTAQSNAWASDGGAESTLVYGGSTDNWGLTLVESSFTNANFRVRASLTLITGGATSLQLDWIPVQIYYTAGVATAATYNPILFAGD